ncbi:hypothetical protein J4455_05580 [Candidatus Woesearchaeota archaeon]|nr:hypothetical protein [uncultured archaeon]MBS3150125.1 hypothetical protein [Candidatus Woesearchaeota archaeon]
MKLNEEIESKLKELLVEIESEEAFPIIKFIINKRNVSEFKISDKLLISINQVRNLIYKLNNYNLVTYIRKKDKKKGWFIYYWTFHVKEALSSLDNMKSSKIEGIKKKLKEESDTLFFSCPDKCTRVDFETALENNFKCIECGKVLKEESNVKEIGALSKELKGLEKRKKEEISN